MSQSKKKKSANLTFRAFPVSSRSECVPLWCIKQKSDDIWMQHLNKRQHYIKTKGRPESTRLCSGRILPLLPFQLWPGALWLWMSPCDHHQDTNVLVYIFSRCSLLCLSAILDHHEPARLVMRFKGMSFQPA